MVWTAQAEYRRLHAAILEGRAPPQYAVAAHDSGLADGLTGGVTIFLFALLTGRAFQWDMLWGEAKYEWGYSQPNINWSATRGKPDGIEYHGEGWGSSWDSIPAGPAAGEGGSQFYYVKLNWYTLPNGTEATIFKRGNLSTIGEGYETVFFYANHGLTLHLFNNPFHRARLREMGLRPDTAFGCVTDFLLAPSPAVRTKFAAEFQALSDAAALKIGIQVRSDLGDFVMGDAEQDDMAGNADAARFGAWFDCAARIEADMRVGNQLVIWFLVSDSKLVRAKAKERFGAKLLTRTDDVSVGHINPWAPNGGGGEDNFISAAGENWVFGLTDFQVISQFSGFGRTAAMRSRRWQSVYQFDNVNLSAVHSCGPEDHVRLEDMVLGHGI